MSLTEKAALASLLASLAGGACRSEPSPRNLLLISIDTLRADHLSSYGFPKETTPHIDALAAEGARFEDVVSPVPLTLPAHSSMLTGTLPTRHGVHDNLGYALPDSSTTLAELLRARGLATGAVVSSFVLDSRFHLDQGFDSYDDDFQEAHQVGTVNERKGDETTAVALRYLDAHRDGPFFLFVHYYDPHDDYAPPEPFRSRFEGDPYSGEIAFADEQVGRLVEKLRELGLEDSTLVVVTGDHGEMLGEHGEPTHGFFVYQSALRVPLVLKWPGGIAPRTVRERAGLIDLVPTVAGLFGFQPPTEVQGRDLSPMLRGEESPPGPRRELYVESFTANRYYGARPIFGLLTDEYKYIHTTRPELYDLASDPEESVNVLDAHPRIAEGMKRRLAEILSEAEEHEAGASADEETRRRLASLGYLSGSSADAELSLEGEGDDPKDWIDFYARHQRLEKLVDRGAYDEARELASEMIEEDPRFAAGHLQLARIATEERDLRLAREHYEKALAIDPDNAGARFNLGNIEAELGDDEAAIASFRAAIALDPGLPDAQERLDFLLSRAGAGEQPGPRTEAELRSLLEREPENGEAHYRLANLLAARSRWEEAASHFEHALAAAPPAAAAEIHHRLALALRETGRTEEALAHLQAARELAPDAAAVESDLAATLKRLGRPDEAIEHYRRAVALDPRLAVAWNDLGSLLGARGRLDEARDAFQRAVDADDGHAVAHNNLGLALRMTGERDAALAQFERACELRPDWPVPLRELAWIRATHPDAAHRDPERAVGLATRANELTGGSDPVVLDTLAAAYAARGDFDLAAETAAGAADLATSRAPKLAEQIRARAALYREKKPFIEP